MLIVIGGKSSRPAGCSSSPHPRTTRRGGGLRPVAPRRRGKREDRPSPLPGLRSIRGRQVLAPAPEEVTHVGRDRVARLMRETGPEGHAGGRPSAPRHPTARWAAQRTWWARVPPPPTSCG